MGEISETPVLEVAADDWAAITAGIEQARTGGRVQVVHQGRVVAAIVPVDLHDSPGHSDRDDRDGDDRDGDDRAKLLVAMHLATAHAATTGALTMNHYREFFGRQGMPWPGAEVIAANYLVTAAP